MKSIDTSLMSSLCEGLVGYATYESHAGLGAAMSEVVFYMPVLTAALPILKLCGSSYWRTVNWILLPWSEFGKS
jgi:hypothetical protein